MAKPKTASKSLPSQADLNRLLRYEPETGKLFWRERTAEMFESGRHSAAHTCAKWNSRCAGKEAFTSINSTGYRHGTISARFMLAHRIIWKMQTGIDPDEIDHLDGHRSNNKWTNLRDASRIENRRNMARRKDNSSGHVGVRWSAKSHKWQAFVGRLMLGTFTDFNDAVAAREAAAKTLNFHPNHGREATT